MKRSPVSDVRRRPAERLTGYAGTLGALLLGLGLDEGIAEPIAILIVGWLPSVISAVVDRARSAGNSVPPA